MVEEEVWDVGWQMRKGCFISEPGTVACSSLSPVDKSPTGLRSPLLWLWLLWAPQLSGDGGTKGQGNQAQDGVGGPCFSYWPEDGVPEGSQDKRAGERALLRFPGCPR